jgi:hypothetical protein
MKDNEKIELKILKNEWQRDWFKINIYIYTYFFVINEIYEK